MNDTGLRYVSHYLAISICWKNGQDVGRNWLCDERKMNRAWK